MRNDEKLQFFIKSCRSYAWYLTPIPSRTPIFTTYVLRLKYFYYFISVLNPSELCKEFTIIAINACLIRHTARVFGHRAVDVRLKHSGKQFPS